MKYVDRTIGRLLTRSLPIPSPGTLLTPGNILILRPGGIGDAVHLAPLIKTLRRAYPEAAIDILAERRNGAVFSLVDGVTSVFQYDTLLGLLRVLGRGYDLVIDTEQWHRLSAVVARFIAAKMTIGYATNERRNLFTHAVPYSQDEYESDSFMNLLIPLHIAGRGTSAPPLLTIPEATRLRADDLLGELAEKRFVTLFPGASIKERRWGAQNFAELAAKLQLRGIPIVVIGGGDESAEGNAIASRVHGLNLAGKTTLVETAAVLERTMLLVSGDSGILHMAVGLGKPTVSLFGPGRASKWAPRGKNDFVINKSLACSPCTSFGSTPKCPIDAKCLSDISVDDVLEAIDKLMISQQ